MGWAAIITAIIELFGPVLRDWLRRWLEDRLAEAAAKLPKNAKYAGNGERVAALCDAAIAGMGPAPLRKALLRAVKRLAVERGGDLLTPLSKAEAKAVGAAAKAAAGE